MKKQNNEIISNVAQSLLNSGNVEIRIDGKPFSTVSINKGTVDIEMEDRKLSKNIFKKMPKMSKRRKMLSQFSSFVASLGVIIEIRDQKGLILKIGKGAHSVLGNFEAKLVKLEEYF